MSIVKKKVKSKSQPKTRIIKFHEYTVGELFLDFVVEFMDLHFCFVSQGPPNVKKQSSASQLHSETSYELLLQQQQMFLQWQLECQQKYPHMTPAQVTKI